jgi:hypothetical protein
MLGKLWTTVSISHWKLVGAPKRPMGVMAHWNCPSSGTVKAVYSWALGCSSSCQNLAVKLMVVKIVLPDGPMSLIHSPTSLMEYLSVWVRALRAQKSCTSQMSPFFLEMAKIGLLKGLLAGWIMPSLSHSVTVFPPPYTQWWIFWTAWHTLALRVWRKFQWWLRCCCLTNLYLRCIH